MEPPPPVITRATTVDRLTTTRTILHTIIADLDHPQLERQYATEEWTLLDLLRHIWVWNELCTRTLSDWHGNRDWVLTFGAEDQFNVEMVAARAHASFEQVLAGIEQAYRFYDTILAECNDAELAERAAAPWGQELSRVELIWFELGHDLSHLDQLKAALG